MRLQRLEINGFKSFPDRSELRFDQGVTAIVGPNGCGKSNLVDAITWVLGEQSAKSLRGDRMEDVIFSGSDARKPTGAAEVRLRLTGVTAAAAHGRDPGGPQVGPAAGNGHAAAGDADGRPDGANGNGHHAVGAVPAGGPDPNVDLDEGPVIAREIEVSRRLYRSGESEYLIDGEVCRLRDVQDLLMDAGVGVKAYAVIEQGKIGQILSTRPTERRVLIEEAAGVTKYKTRRRSAELKLEAAQQNLTRVDDIIFELEKQRGALKRQAARARRYRTLREELRRWEKVLFARRYRHLTEAIEAARARLAAAREREELASARVAEIEGRQERVRIELAEAESAATAAREEAHARELEIGRRQQQIQFDRSQIEMLAAAADEIERDLAALDARRGPAAEELGARRLAAATSDRERDEAAEKLGAVEAEYAAARQAVEGLEGDVEAARSEVFAAINAATALRHAIEHAADASSRIADELGRLDLEAAEVAREREQATAERETAAAALRRATEALEATRVARATRESELASARIEREWRVREQRQQEHGLAGMQARLRSLEELDAARAGYGDAARLVLAESNGEVSHLGSVADYLDVERPYERAVEAALHDLLQHVLVERHEHAAAGLRFVRERNAGRCGFLVVDGASLDVEAGGSPPTEARAAHDSGGPALVPIASVVHVHGPGAAAIGDVVKGAWMAESLEQAVAAAPRVSGPVATPAGDVALGAHVVLGGTRDEARGILATKREIKELRDAVAAARVEADRLGAEIGELDVTIARAESASAALDTERHRQEKAIVGLELQAAAAAEAIERLTRKQELLAAERRRAAEEQASLEDRQREARASIDRLEGEQRAADERFMQAQRRLFEARDSIDGLARRAAEAKAAHAMLAERSVALAADVRRLEEAAAELAQRLEARQQERDRTRQRRAALVDGIAESERLLDADVRTFDSLRDQVRTADERVAGLRDRHDGQQGEIREARQALEAVRGEAAQLEVGRATAEADLGHLEASCADTLQLTLPEVAAEVDELARTSQLQLEDGLAVALAEPADEEDEGGADRPADAPLERVAEAEARVATVEEVIARLKTKIDRLGPVNMMAIEQFDELETRYGFLTTQRRDLVDSIAATAEAIKRIDRTTRERFREAFEAINGHFQETFSTLFGGGRAGLILLDEADLLESGVDILAQPPGKRLQSVQLLSGGEKALTAMALMFAIFKYRPSPFCLLDEIDAPLDDANIGRFIEMLRGMQTDTQFVLITHNRKTMEIADRLYGVTMEEPGVSKLISVQLN